MIFFQTFVVAVSCLPSIAWMGLPPSLPYFRCKFFHMQIFSGDFVSVCNSFDYWLLHNKSFRQL